MKRRYLVTFITLMVSLVFFSLPFNSIISNNNFEFPIWSNSLKDLEKTPNTPDIAPITDDNNVLESKGNEEPGNLPDQPDQFIAQNSTSAVINFNNSFTSYQTDPYALFTDIGDIAFPTVGFNVTYVNLTFFNILTQGYLFDVETDGLSKGAVDVIPFGGAVLPYIDPENDIDPITGQPFVMSFQIEHGFISYMAGLDLRLRNPNFDETLIFCYILNASFNPATFQIEPNTSVGAAVGYLNGLGWKWVHCEGYATLNTYNTENNTFFVLPGVIDPTQTTEVYWDYMYDPPMAGSDGQNEGIAYLHDLIMWNLLDIDFCVKQIDITGCAPPPSRIDMRINGTLLPDSAILYSNVTEETSLIAYASKYFNNTFLNGESGTIFYDIETNWSSYNRSLYVLFMINVTGGFQNQTNAITRCFATAGNSIVNWNASVQGMYFPQGAYDKKINITIPKSWNVSEVYENSTKINYSIISKPPYKFVNINATANGSWTVICNGTNWAGDIDIYNNTPPFIKANSYYLNDTIKINGTIHANSLIKANLTAFNPNNITVHIDQANIINEVASFTPWRIFDNSSRNGTHRIRVVWFNGTEVGINMTKILCYNEPTNLTVTQGPDPPVVIAGEIVTAKIFYNDTYTNKSISGAMIDSNWSYSPLNTIDWLNGSYNITFFTGFAPKGNYTIEINAKKIGYETATTIIKFNVTLLVVLEPTELKIVNNRIPYTGEDIYVNDTGKYAIVNYTFQVNGSGIKGASIMTDPDWADPYFQAEDLSLGNASRRGLYKIWIDSTGTHASESHHIRFFASKPGLEPSEVISSSFDIYAIPTDIDVTGYEYIRKFEGEIVDLAACYKDNYHAGKPAITNAVVNWTINTTTPESGDMDLVILIYQGTINLPELEVSPGTYNVTIKAEAPDFRPYSKNITLKVDPKWSTLISITNYSSYSQTEIRVGKDVTIEAKIQFGNSSIEEEGHQLNYEIDYSNGFHTEDDRITNVNGTTKYVINPIPNIRWINVTVSYDGTPQINASSSNLRINITGKHETNLTINDEQMTSYIISGEEFIINATLEYNKSGEWTPMQGETIEFIIDYENYQDEDFITTTNEEGLAILDFIPPDGATSVIVRVLYIGNISFSTTNDNSTSFRITKYNVTLQIFDINPLELMVGNPLILSCELTYSETGHPIANATVTFFIYMGDSDVKIFEQSAVTDKDGIATTILIVLQPFEILPFITVGVEYEGDESKASITTTSPLPTIPMTTTKYILNYVDENWWWMAIIVGVVVGISLAYRYGVKLPRRRREIALQRKIANKVKDAQNLKHCIILEKNSGAAIFDQGFGDIELDSDLISGFLTAISAFQTEIAVKGKKKEEPTGGFELSYADFKILLTDGELSRFAFILQDKPGDSFRQVAQETVNKFESDYGAYLREWDGAVKPFSSANLLLASKFETGLSQALRIRTLSEKEIKNLSDLSSVLVKIAKSQQEQKKGKFFIDDIINIAIQARKEQDYEIYYDIYNLYKNRIFIPLSKKIASYTEQKAKI